MTKFQPTHLLTITVGNRTERAPVAVVDADWVHCAPEAGALLATADEWRAEGSVSYTLNNDGELCCNGDAYGWGSGEWSLDPLTDAGKLGAIHGAEDRAHDDGEVCDEDGIEVAATPRSPIAWASEALALEYRAVYSAARG